MPGAIPKAKGTNGWEEMPYWLKGYGDLGYVLGDKPIIDDARRWIDAMLASQEADGWFGPQSNKSHPEAGGKADFWPNMLMLNVLQSYYEYSDDKRVLPFMTKYFHWQLNYKDADFLTSYWAKMRAGDNLESVYWLYNRTGEPWLLELAEKIHRRTAAWSAGVTDWHGVNLSQGFREPAVYFMQAGKQRLLDAAERNYQHVHGHLRPVSRRRVRRRRKLPARLRRPAAGLRDLHLGRVHAQFRDADQDLRQPPLGRPLRGRRLQLAARRPVGRRKGAALPDRRQHGSVRHQDKAPGIGNGGNMLAFSPWNFRCCQHNVSHGWPYFAEELWLATADRGLCASLYAP